MEDSTKWNSPTKCIKPDDEIIMNIDIKERKMEYIVQRGTECYSYSAIPIDFPDEDQKYRMIAYYNIDLLSFNKIVRT